MYIIDLDILIRQILPPSWRGKRQLVGADFVFVDSGRFKFLKSVLTPFKTLFKQFDAYRSITRRNVNLNAEVFVLEHHIRVITGLGVGVSVSDGATVGMFEVIVPSSVSNYTNEIISFLKKVTPSGRDYVINYY